MADQSASTLSKTISELESEDLMSFETSVPTDLTLSPESDEHKLLAKHQRLTSGSLQKHLIEKKQLQHDLQVLKIELSQKSLTIDNLKADYMTKVDDLEEKLVEALQQKHTSQARLEAQNRIDIETARQDAEEAQHQLNSQTMRMNDIENENADLRARAFQLRRTLEKDVNVDDHEKYQQLKRQDVDIISLQDYFMVKVCDYVWPISEELAAANRKIALLNKDIANVKDDNQRITQSFESCVEECSSLKMQLVKTQSDAADFKARLQLDDIQRENYDKLKKEKVEFEHKIAKFENSEGVMAMELGVITKERDTLKTELLDCVQRARLLEQDNVYLSRQLSEASVKLSSTEVRLDSVSSQLDSTLKTKHELYDKYTSARNEYGAEYERRLREELARVRDQTGRDTDRLQAQIRDAYEREIGSLKESRDVAVVQRDRAEQNEKEVKTKYERLTTEFRQMQSAEGGRGTDLRCRLEVAIFDLERTRMQLNETDRQRRQQLIENDKLKSKLDILTSEMYKAESELKQRLVGNEAEQPRSTIRDRDQDLADLVKLNADLSDLNSRLNREVALKTDQIEQQADELRRAKELLKLTPDGTTVGLLQDKDEEIGQMRAALSSLSSENNRLRDETDRMMRDLQSLIIHMKDLGVIKQLVLKQLSSLKATTAPHKRLASMKTAYKTKPPVPMRRQSLPVNADSTRKGIEAGKSALDRGDTRSASSAMVEAARRRGTTENKLPVRDEDGVIRKAVQFIQAARREVSSVN